MMIKTQCDFCGNYLEFYPSQFKKSKNHFCDSICFGNWRSENRRNENHPNWQGGKKPYCSKFNEKLKEKLGITTIGNALCVEGLKYIKNILFIT